MFVQSTEKTKGSQPQKENRALSPIYPLLIHLFTERGPSAFLAPCYNGFYLGIMLS